MNRFLITEDVVSSYSICQRKSYQLLLQDNKGKEQILVISLLTHLPIEIYIVGLILNVNVVLKIQLFVCGHVSLIRFVEMHIA